MYTHTHIHTHTHTHTHTCTHALTHARTHTQVCRIWKSGGLLPEEVNCAEFTPLDVYQLRSLAKNKEQKTSLLQATMRACLLEKKNMNGIT